MKQTIPDPNSVFVIAIHNKDGSAVTPSNLELRCFEGGKRLNISQLANVGGTDEKPLLLSCYAESCEAKDIPLTRTSQN